MIIPVETKRLSKKAKQSEELSEEKSEEWSDEKKQLEEWVMKPETGQSDRDDLKQQIETLTNAFGDNNDLKIRIETLEKEKQDFQGRYTNADGQLKFNEGQWSMRKKDCENQIRVPKNRLKRYEDETKNNSPSPDQGKSTSASGCRQSSFRGKKSRYIYFIFFLYRVALFPVSLIVIAESMRLLGDVKFRCVLEILLPDQSLY